MEWTPQKAVADIAAVVNGRTVLAGVRRRHLSVVRAEVSDETDRVAELERRLLSVIEQYDLLNKENRDMRTKMVEQEALIQKLTRRVMAANKRAQDQEDLAVEVRVLKELVYGKRDRDD